MQKLAGVPLTTLNSHCFVWIPEPTNVTSNATQSGPSVILLCGWMNGELPTLKRHFVALKTMYPHATIFIIRSSTTYLWSTPKGRLAMVTPVAQQLLAIRRREGSKFRGVLSICISNGGAWQLMQIAKLLVAAAPSEPKFPKQTPVAFVLDSTPHIDAEGLSSAMNTFTIPYKGTPLFYPSMPPLALFYGGVVLLDVINGARPKFAELRETVNDPSFLSLLTGVVSKDAIPRLYIYSEKDVVTTPHNIESHIAEAVKKGFKVSVEKFTDTEHVAHARGDPKRYFSAVERIWEDAVGVVPAMARL